MRSLASLAMRAAERLAAMLPTTASTEHSSITPPQRAIWARERRGTTVSMTKASIQGRSRSMTVPRNLMVSPQAIFLALGRR